LFSTRINDRRWELDGDLPVVEPPLADVLQADVQLVVVDVPDLPGRTAPLLVAHTELDLGLGGAAGPQNEPERFRQAPLQLLSLRGPLGRVFGRVVLQYALLAEVKREVLRAAERHILDEDDPGLAP
jgi:hypothetical protein